MKKSILLVFLVGILFSCSNIEDETSVAPQTLVGTWKLKEILFDPGDGSGTFQSVNSTKTLIFDTNGNVTSNGSICDMSIETNASSIGTYSEANSSINPSNCPNLTLNYELNANTLVIIYPYIELCKAKYIRVQ
jgi:hypothetical protein